MKQTSIITVLILLFMLALTACKEDVYMDWKLQNEQWYNNLKEKHKKESNFVTTPSGIIYKVVYQGWKYDRMPNANSSIRVKYTGTLIDGSTFDYSNDTIIDLSKKIKGWKEVIPKMNNRGNYILYIPSSLGYGTASTNVKIPPYSTLIFDIELIDSKD